MVLSIVFLGIVVGYVAQTVFRPEVSDQIEINLQQQGDNLQELAKQGEWLQLWWAIPKSQLWRFESTGSFVLALLTGSCWLVFTLQALQVGSLRDPRIWLALAGVALGVLSIWPNSFFSLWQEELWGLRQSRSLIPGLRFFVIGVGLREEFSKLLCLLPLMPLLLRMRSELTALLISGCVGIGFALAENAGYFARSGGSDAMGRYLTANPAHLTLTALTGLAVYRGIRSPRDWAMQAVAIFGVMVFAHGLYDAFIVLPALAEYSLLGSIVFILVVYQFFRELREARIRRPEIVSLTANFLCGVSLVTAATFVYLSATVGCATAFDVLAQGVLGLAVMVYLFLREMPETLVSV